MATTKQRQQMAKDKKRFIKQFSFCEKAPKMSDTHQLVKKITNCDDEFFNVVKSHTGNNVEILKKIKVDGHKILKCHENAPKLAAMTGGKTVKGWVIYMPTNSLAGGVMYNSGVVELNQHMVVEGTDGRLYDSTPFTEEAHGSAMRAERYHFFIRDDRLLTDDSPVPGSMIVDFTNGAITHTWGPNWVYVSGHGNLPEHNIAIKKQKLFVLDVL
jgi:hypothetical protein